MWFCSLFTVEEEEWSSFRLRMAILKHVVAHLNDTAKQIAKMWHSSGIPQPLDQHS